MRRFACHYLYVSADGCYSKYVVELEDSGRVRAYFPLKEELSATQWIGGVIIISPMYGLEICSGEKFADFLHRAMLEQGDMSGCLPESITKFALIAIPPQVIRS